MGSQRSEHGKWTALLQPIKDLEKNWDVDIAGELTDYLEDLSALTFEVDGLANLNFAEAALVVYSSSCTYGKKVEYLMKLTMSALEAAKARNKSNSSCGKKRKGDQNNLGSILGVLDVIDDIVKADGKIPNLDLATLDEIRIPPRLPPLLLDASDTAQHRTIASSELGNVESGMAKSTATSMSPSDAPSFNMMRCHMHASGAMLLLESDGDAYDANLNSISGIGASRGGQPNFDPLSIPMDSAVHPVPTQQGAAPAAFGSPVMNMNQAPQSPAAVTGSGDDVGAWGDDADDHMDDPLEPMDVSVAGGHGMEAQIGHAAHLTRAQTAAADAVGTSSAHADAAELAEPFYDPYEPLDAHDASSAIHKPFRMAIPRISNKRSTRRTACAAPHEPASSQGFGACGPAFEPPAPSAQGASDIGGDDDAEAPGWLWGDMQDDDGDVHEPPSFAFDDAADDADGDRNNTAGMQNDFSAAAWPAADLSQSSLAGSAAYDELVAMYSQAVTAAATATDMQSSLSKKVSSWRSNIGSIMVEQDHRPPFDIQEAGSKILEHVIDLVDEPSADEGEPLPFDSVVHCDHKFEVARSFSAFLQLVNNGKVDVLRGRGPADPFFVKLLSSKNDVAVS